MIAVFCCVSTDFTQPISKEFLCLFLNTNAALVNSVLKHWFATVNNQNAPNAIVIS